MATDGKLVEPMAEKFIKQDQLIDETKNVKEDADRKKRLWT